MCRHLLRYSSSDNPVIVDDIVTILSGRQATPRFSLPIYPLTHHRSVSLLIIRAPWMSPSPYVFL